MHINFFFCFLFFVFCFLFYVFVFYFLFIFISSVSPLFFFLLLWRKYACVLAAQNSTELKSKDLRRWQAGTAGWMRQPARAAPIPFEAASGEEGHAGVDTHSAVATYKFRHSQRAIAPLPPRRSIVPSRPFSARRRCFHQHSLFHLLHIATALIEREKKKKTKKK